VTRKNGDVVPQRIDLFADPAEEEVAIASGKVPAAHTTREKDVSAKQHPFGFPEETEAARAVARNVEYLEVEPTQVAGRRFINQKAIADRFNLPAKPVILEKVGLGHHRKSVGVVPDRTGVFALDARGVPNMVDMPVGQEEQRHTVASFAQPFGGILWRVDQDTRAGQEKAVRVKDTAGECVQCDEV